MTELVGDDVRIREIAGRTESSTELVEETGVEIDLVIVRTIERSGRGVRHATRRFERITEQHDLRPLVTISENVLPRVLHVTGDRVDHVDGAFFRRRACRRAL